MRLDRDQRCDFEVITASFVLSYYREAVENNDNLTAQDNTAWKAFIKEKFNGAYGSKSVTMISSYVVCMVQLDVGKAQSYSL